MDVHDCFGAMYFLFPILWYIYELEWFCRNTEWGEFVLERKIHPKAASTFRQ